MCAMMYPQKEDITDLPFSEREVYEFLEKLGEGYVVFHSVQWMKRSNKWKSTWKENDFLIFGKETKGLPEELLSKNKDLCMRIPMISEARSLNLSNSVAIVVYEALRQTGFDNLQSFGELHNLNWQE